MILSQVNSIYDPLGLATPFTVRAKMLLRQLNMNEEVKLGWDDPIPDEYHQDWVNFFTKLFQMKQITFSRTIKPVGAIGKSVLVIFSDASEHAYGACAYIQWELKDNRFASRLLISKSRLAPIKKITIVRLELNAALMAKRLKVTIEKEMRIQFARSYYIVDSECVQCCRESHMVITRLLV